MTAVLIHEENVDIYHYPDKDTQHLVTPHTQFIVGDLHGNAVKLLYFLLRQNIVDVSPKNFSEFVTLYRKPTAHLTQEDMLLFNTILQNIVILKKPKIIFLGDELADRGSNDYFTLKMLERLWQANVEMQIIASNHGMEFILACENKNLQSFVISADQTVSLHNLRTLVDKKLVNAEEIFAFYAAFYKPALRLLTVLKNNNELIICSHAPIGLTAIQALANQFAIPFHAADLSATVDNINRHFSEFYLYKNQVTSLYLDEFLPISESTPLKYILWNRNYQQLDRPKMQADHQLIFVHGHDDTEFSQGNIINLDTQLGKFIEAHQGIYAIFFIS